MNKSAADEKRQMVDDACKLFTEAIEKTREAKQLLHLCGIECCGGLIEKKIDECNNYVSNIQIFCGIKNLSDIIGAEPDFRHTCYDKSKVDKSRCYIDYGGITFLQFCPDITSAPEKFTFL